MHKAHNIVIGQNVTEGKKQRARELRSTMTNAEKIFWEHVRANKLGGFHFRRQQIIDGFIVDFYCHQAQLVIEIDGSSHEDKHDYDESRDEILSSRGLEIMRFSNEQILTDIDGVLTKIGKLLPDPPFPLREGG